jgi:glycosyltransferase involved in cell wall biosynthesis
VLSLGTSPQAWPANVPLKIHTDPFGYSSGVSLSLIRDIRRVSSEPCILHDHGIWRMANLFPLFVSGNTPARMICSPRGMLSSWSMNHKFLIKQPFWNLLQKPALKRCHCFHATAVSEYESIRHEGLSAPVAIIPNGIDIPKLDEKDAKKKRVVFLSRIDPKKGLDMLIPAWHAIASEFPDWDLVIAGPLNSGYARSMQSLANTLGAPRTSFIGQTLGEEKRRLLSTASLFVLPTYSENFGLVIAEALAHGTPVITTTETPWEDVPARKCGWIIPPERTSLESAMRQAMHSPLPELASMGQSGRRWMQADYSWQRSAEMMQQTYRWLLDGGDRPEWVKE